MSLESSKGIYSIRELIPDDKESVLAIWSEGRSFLKEMGVSQVEDSYIVNYKTGEVINETLKVTRSGQPLYVYATTNN